MVRMGTVWDDTMRVLSGRAAIVTRIALLTVFLPSVVAAAIAAASGGVLARPLASALNLVIFLVTLLGTLALTAVASDPKVDERAAYRRAGSALPFTVVAVLLVGAVLAALSLPGAALMVAAGFDVRAAALGQPQPALAPGPFLAASLYFLVYALVLVWVVSRLMLLYAVAINEAPGLGAIRRSFVLTRGLTWRIVGVLILYAIVVFVAWSATQSVFGLLFRLLLGVDQARLAAFLTAIPVAVVTTAMGLLQPIFAARLYAAVRERDGAAA